MYTFKYPTYLVWREYTNIFPTAPRRICLRALSAELYCLNSGVASVKDRRSLAMAAAVAPAVMIAVAPGLNRGTKLVAERMLHTAG